MDDLPRDLDPGLVVKAAAQLLSDAARFGRRVQELVAPEVADAEEERLLRADERRGRADMRVSFHPRGDGVTDVVARVPDHVAERLRVYLDSFTAPRRGHLDGRAGGRHRPALPAARRGEAFCALLERVPTDRLPVHGGTATSVVVTIDSLVRVSGGPGCPPAA